MSDKLQRIRKLIDSVPEECLGLFSLRIKAILDEPSKGDAKDNTSTYNCVCGKNPHNLQCIEQNSTPSRSSGEECTPPEGVCTCFASPTARCCWSHGHLKSCPKHRPKEEKLQPKQWCEQCGTHFRVKKGGKHTHIKPKLKPSERIREISQKNHPKSPDEVWMVDLTEFLDEELG